MLRYLYRTHEKHRDQSTVKPAKRIQQHSAYPVTHPLLQMQRLLGNRAVNKLLQAKFTVNAPDDHFEREADRIASVVLDRMNAPNDCRLQDHEVGNRVAIPVLRLKATHDSVNTRLGNAVAPSVETEIDLARGHGQSLPDAVRAPIEEVLGADLSAVRIHTNEVADRLSQSLGAAAFTTGADVFFSRGHYDPCSRSGRHLLAHELTHVVQQTGVRSGLSKRTALQARSVSTAFNCIQCYPRYLANPQWGPYDLKTGGTWMRVILGPDACLPVNRGSVADPTKPSIMPALRLAYPGYNFKSGHLLNDNMGGLGNDPENLTPLTGKANRRHATYETRIKNAIDIAHNRAVGYPTDDSWYGVSYRVVVKPTKWSNNPADTRSAVADGIRVVAKPVMKDKTTSAILDADIDPGKFFSKATIVKDVENEQ